MKPLRPQAKHVIFEGADDLPKGPYGTSQKLSWAANKEKGMMIGASWVIPKVNATLRDLTLTLRIGLPLPDVNISASSLGDEWSGT